ncbi:CLUMA_CG001548, isoform A [Clunio marinus]|uniref:CLUMA_CG001548, isoform A n=1 Tax=Clunio marinus TaxID=568069 RepID=A0A1J1HI93_9DIPT|nr:CLUMA_CG001548, isoform A [Clunio marinus]
MMNIPNLISDILKRKSVIGFDENQTKTSSTIFCRAICFGSYRIKSEKVVLTSKGIQIVAPSSENKDLTVLNIQHSEIVKLVTSFGRPLIIFIYTKPSTARYIREQLKLSENSEISPHFSPVSPNESQRKITLLADNFTAKDINAIKSVCDSLQLEEINHRDAQEMLFRSTGISFSKH